MYSVRFCRETNNHEDIILGFPLVLCAMWTASHPHEAGEHFGLESDEHPIKDCEIGAMCLGNKEESGRPGGGKEGR